MRLLSLTILALLVAWSPSNAQVRQSRRLQDDETEFPTATPEFGGDDLGTAPPTPAGSAGSPEGGSVNGTTPEAGDVGDEGNFGNVPTPAPEFDFSDTSTPAPADDGFPGDGGDMAPTPSPSIADGPPTFDVPTFDEPTFDEPTFDEPTFDEPTFDEPTFDEPTFDEPTFDDPTFENPTDAPAVPTAASPVEQPTEAPVITYVSNDDYDPLLDEDLEAEEADWDSETLEEMEHDQNVLIALSIVGGVGLCFTLVAAQQLIENPDGCCSR
jgi:hypothetical protein